LRNIYRVTVVVGATKRQCHHLWLCLLSETREIERIGLHGHAGLFRGCTSWLHIRHEGPEHVVAFATIQSGKGHLCQTSV